MRFAVMGAGAVGCFFGAMLARAGQGVTLIGRPALVESIEAEGGLLLEMGEAITRVPIGVSSSAHAVAGADVVLFCVKSTDTEKAGQEMLPHLNPRTLVLSLQNGVDNAERLAAVIGRPVVPVAVYVATDMAAPGHVRHHGRGDLIVGAQDGCEEVAEVLHACGVPAAVSDTVVSALWSKLVMNCAYNALSAVAQVPYGVLVDVAEVPPVMDDVVAECRAVATAAGIALEGPDLESVLALARAMPRQYSSTAQDVARGKPTEIDYLNGYVVRKGEELGVPTPVNRLLHAMVKVVEQKRPDDDA